MKTVLNKVIFSLFFLYASWKGLDGLFINYYSSSLHELDIESLEKKGCDNNRYLKINNGVTAGTFIYLEENNYSNIDVYYPIISHKQAELLRLGRPITAHLIVQINNLNRNCIKDETCYLIDSTSVTGITKEGFDDLRRDDFKSMETDLLTIDKNAILIEPDIKPIALHWNLLMFIGGTIFAFTLLKSFFRKASGLREYWVKITEKDES